MLTDRRRHGDADVGVHIDLADRHGGSLAQHILGDTDGVGHLAAVPVDGLDIFLIYGACAVQDDREAGELFRHFLQNVEAKLRLLTGLEFISAVACADGNGKGVHTGAGHEVIDLIGIREMRVVLADVDIILDARKLAELALDHHAVCVGVIDDLFGQRNVFFIRQMAAVDHNGGKAAVDARLAGLKIRAVVKVQRNGQTRFFGSGLHHGDQIPVGRIFARARRDLQDHGGIVLLGGTGDALDDLHIVDVERADGVTAFISFFEHFGSGD